MSTYNGASFLREQLDSLISQTHRDWVIFASDDGSCDATLTILSEYQLKLGQDRLAIFPGPRKGFSANFLSLLKRPELVADYYAYCDQDDVWNTHKLEYALQWLASSSPATPALFCSRTRLVDESGIPIGFSPLFRRPPSFRNALVQSIAGGNTMVMNRAAKELLAKTPPNTIIVSHDWWAYLLVTGCGGTVYYEGTPQVDYRQHGRNLMGSNTRLRDRFARMNKMFNGTFKAWNSANIEALMSLQSELTPSSLSSLIAFRNARGTSFISRIVGLRRAGVHRQSKIEDIALTAAMLINRV
nr:glycosyltransferase family 2 protein [Pseudomonas sp. DP-17]